MDESRYVRYRGEMGKNGEGVVGSPVKWLPEEYFFFRIPRNIQIPYNCIGMDAASAAAVHALQLGALVPGDCVWDVCAAPGMKSMLMVDVVKGKNIRIVATDVNEQRLRVFRNIAKQLEVSDWFRENVFLQAGVKRELFEKFVINSKKRISNKRKREISIRLEQNSSEENVFPGLFARVLVDAECSHDGSTKHVEKHAEAGFWTKLDSESKIPKVRYPYDDPAKYEELLILQRGLITAGFLALKPDGILVYSTCSLDPRQNQEIVQFLLDSQTHAQLQPLPFSVLGDACEDSEYICPAKRVHGDCCLFDPAVSGTSGQFIAVIKNVSK